MGTNILLLAEHMSDHVVAIDGVARQIEPRQADGRNESAGKENVDDTPRRRVPLRRRSAKKLVEVDREQGAEHDTDVNDREKAAVDQQDAGQCDDEGPAGLPKRSAPHDQARPDAKQAQSPKNES